MFRHFSKALFRFCLALALVVAAAVPTQAGGPMSFDVTRCATSASRGGNQIVEFNFFANNLSQFEYITRLNWIEIEVTARRVNGEITRHRFIRKLNYVFNPTLPPRKRMSLRHRFSVHTGPNPYARVAVRITRWNFTKAR